MVTVSESGNSDSESRNLEFCSDYAVNTQPARGASVDTGGPVDSSES